MSNKIKTYSQYGDPRMMAARDGGPPAPLGVGGNGSVHGLTPQAVEDMRERFETMMPSLSSGTSPTYVNDVLGDILPKGAAFTPGAGDGYRNAKRSTDMRARQGNSSAPSGASFGSSGTFTTSQRPYQPEFESPDRQQYPVHRVLANRYWRLFYKLDPVIGNAIDLYAELPWSDFQLTGDGVDGEIKDTMEHMCEETQLRSILPFLIREFLVIGEVAPHLFFDDDQGMWTYIAMHNPDQLEVLDAPFVKMDPVVEFVPDHRLREVLMSDNAALRKVRESMPKELLDKILGNENIPLSPVNFTFLARKLHPYDSRGTSIISRMWRALMYEDCFPCDTLVGRPDGSYTPISELVEGDTVLDRAGHAAVVEAAVERHADTLMRLKLAGGWEQRCTKSHNWPVVRDGESRKLPAEDLRIGDYLSIPRTFDETPTTCSPAQARLLGYYLAEGSRATVNSYYGVAFAFGAHERDTWVRDVESICAELDCPTKTYTHKSGCQVRSHHKASIWLADWLFAHGGELSHAKRMSAEVMSWPLDLKRELLIGYLRGDGSLDTRTCQVQAATTSLMLARQLQLIATQLGVFVTIRDYTPPDNDGRNRRVIAYINATGDRARTLAKWVWDQNIDVSSRHYKKSPIVEPGQILVPIIEVAEEVWDGPVYGITVSNDRSYLVENVGTYNSIFNASIATARRHAGPIKVAKLGNAANGWIPGPEQEKRLLQLLAQAELDVNAWLVYHYALSFELVGTTDRVMTIDKHWELIERIKLIALGISKSFIHGEVTYASAATGLTVFLKRLKAMREFFEDKWLYPKFFRQVAQMNRWVKPTEAELSHRVRVRRSRQEVNDDRRWIVPKIEWEHSLDPTVDNEMINAVQALEGIGVMFSKSTKMALAGRDFEEEAKQRVKDYELERRVYKDYPELMTPVGGEAGGGGGGMGGGGPPPAPPIPGDAFGDALAPGDMNPGGAPGDGPDSGGGGGEGGEPPAASVHGGEESRGKPVKRDDAEIYDEEGRYGIWHKTEIRDLLELFDGYEPEEDPWVDAYADKEVAFAAAGGDPDELWRAVEHWLIDRDFPTQGIIQLEDLLTEQGVITQPAAVHTSPQVAAGKTAIRKPKSRIPSLRAMSKQDQMLGKIKDPVGTSWLRGAG